MASWEILLPYVYDTLSWVGNADMNDRLFSFVLTDGGTPDLFWGFLGVTAGQLLVYASISEAASM